MIVVGNKQGWQVLDGLGKNRLKPPVKTVRKKQVLDSQNGQNYRMMFFFNWKVHTNAFLFMENWNEVIPWQF